VTFFDASARLYKAKKLLSSRFLIASCGPLTSAASAAFLRASSSDEVFAFEVPPSVLGGPPTFLCAGTEEVVFVGGAEERVRPGWEKGSFEDSLLQRAPILYIINRRTQQ
jgi:hypothetical protein